VSIGFSLDSDQHDVKVRHHPHQGRQVYHEQERDIGLLKKEEI
jgi:hypothetical protein